MFVCLGVITKTSVPSGKNVPLRCKIFFSKKYLFTNSRRQKTRDQPEFTNLVWLISGSGQKNLTPEISYFRIRKIQKIFLVPKQPYLKCYQTVCPDRPQVHG